MTAASKSTGHLKEPLIEGPVVNFDLHSKQSGLLLKQAVQLHYPAAA